MVYDEREDQAHYEQRRKVVQQEDAGADEQVASWTVIDHFEIFWQVRRFGNEWQDLSEGRRYKRLIGAGRSLRLMVGAGADYSFFLALFLWP